MPFLGICFGMQMAVIEYARHVCGLERANSSEVDPQTPHPVIDLMDAAARTHAARAARCGSATIPAC